MKQKYLLLILILSLFLSACNDNGDDGAPVDDREFVRGDLIIGIKSDVSINAVFDLMNGKLVVIDQMSGFFNYSTLPNDSLNYITNVLQDKEYFNKRGFSGGSAYVHAVDNRIVVTERFFEMDVEAQQDWLSTMSLLELHDLETDTKSLLIKVLPGTEKQIAEMFTDHPYVKWVELNYIGGFQPMHTDAD